MTNQEKFIEIMNATFGAGFTKRNMKGRCSPCGTLKKAEYGCFKFRCRDCVAWWQKEYTGPKRERKMTIEESRALTVAINSLRFNPDLSDIQVQSCEIALANMRDRIQEGGVKRA